MEGGIISGNRIPNNQHGGGVCFDHNTVTFKKTGGIIYCSDEAEDSLRNGASTITAGWGAAVAAKGLSDPATKLLENTVDAQHDVEKLVADTTAAALTTQKGWTE